ncbi:hypothetical protein Z968_00315 [Clostridium novyi A str. 4552]|uniref:DUF1540 domain-containing protein n=1 Tax=Clostridium novyi A str. 4552 TaxID=1444289 RepID=A0A0A0ID12_CLONO|nr:DUF1540 domain-containing protein [Clostridium novyi]KGM98428.1 hypothetical protein Z968_00315 [Clostridium novyi A str. 4552]
MNNSHDKNHISGVKCVVNSCKYHASDNCCTAKGIEIKSNCDSHTCTSEQTDCATFTPLK